MFDGDEDHWPPSLQRNFCDNLVGKTYRGMANTEYKIGNFIDEGYFSCVYECTDSWGRNLVAKALKPRGIFSSSDEQAKAAHEFAMLQELRHPTIVYVHDILQCETLYVIITERCDGSLNDLLGKNLNLSAIIRPLSKTLFEALAFIHSRGIAHKDVHGGNVLFMRKFDCIDAAAGCVREFRLADVGVASAIENLDPFKSTFANWQRPPEAINPKFGKLDHRADIYHAGLLLLNVTMNRDVRFTQDEILDGAPRQMALNVNSKYSDIIAAALARHPAHRPSTALEFWRGMEFLD